MRFQLRKPLLVVLLGLKFLIAKNERPGVGSQFQDVSIKWEFPNISVLHTRGVSSKTDSAVPSYTWFVDGPG